MLTEKKEFLEQVRALFLPEELYFQEPMKAHTTFRVGGPAELYVKPNRQQLLTLLSLCKEHRVPYFLLGRGSNLLVGDGGISGVVIEIGTALGEITIQGTELRAGAGATLGAIAGAAARAGLGGLEFAAGIPGSLGGAVVMNAGAYGGEIKDVLLWAEVLTPQGEIQKKTPEELELSYRHSNIEERQEVVLEAAFSLNPRPEVAIREEMNGLLQQRSEKQPLEYPSAGSTFKRPEGYFAGKLIMDAGLKGFSVGDAQVAEKHCGFVINRGDATAAEILQLMEEVQRQVREQFGVCLEPEVKFVGTF